MARITHSTMISELILPAQLHILTDQAPCRNFVGDCVLRQPCGHPTPMVWVSSWETSTFAIQIREEAILGTRPSVMTIQVAPLSSLPPSLALWKSLSLTLRARTRGVMVQSTRYPVLIAFSSAELRNFQCHAHTVGSVGDRSAPSDHIPVRLTIVCNPRGTTRRWIAQHPLFISALGDEHNKRCTTRTPSSH